MLKGIMNKLFPSKQSTSEGKNITQEEIEALVDAKVKEHTEKLKSTMTNQVTTSKQKADNDEDYTLSPKQVEYAISLVDKVKNEFELAVDPTKLTIKDLNRLIAYQKYKNKGTLFNLVKKGVLKKK